MDFDELRQILEIVREYDLSEFELEREDFKLRIKKNAAGMWTATTLPPVSHVHYPPTMPPAPVPAAPAGTPGSVALSYSFLVENGFRRDRDPVPPVFPLAHPLLPAHDSFSFLPRQKHTLLGHASHSRSGVTFTVSPAFSPDLIAV
jgi:hypothetical protein